jgi:hypothetical protein
MTERFDIVAKAPDNTAIANNKKTRTALHMMLT